MTTWRKQYHPTIKVTLPVHQDGMTDTSFQDECDINQIMRRYLNGQGFPPNLKVGTYGDFSEAPDFTRAQEIILTARQQFEALPATVRERFQHNPAAFLDFIHDKANLEEAKKLGLLTQQPEPQAPTTTTDTKPPEAKP